MNDFKPTDMRIPTFATAVELDANVLLHVFGEVENVFFAFLAALSSTPAASFTTASTSPTASGASHACAFGHCWWCVDWVWSCELKRTCKPLLPPPTRAQRR